MVNVPFYLFYVAVNCMETMVDLAVYGGLFTLHLNIWILQSSSFDTNPLCDACHPAHDGCKPGRQAVTYLILLNLSQWVVATFELQKSQSSPWEQEFYGLLPWVILQRLTLPVCVFFRSSIPPTGPCLYLRNHFLIFTGFILLSSLLTVGRTHILIHMTYDYDVKFRFSFRPTIFMFVFNSTAVGRL